jgi:hypothetical protein
MTTEALFSSIDFHINLVFYFQNRNTFFFNQILLQEPKSCSVINSLCLDDEGDGDISVRNGLNLVIIKSQNSYAAFLYLIIIRFNFTSGKL